MPAPARATGFPATTPERFLVDYARVVERGDAGAVGAWLATNAPQMSEAMFLTGPDAAFERLKPIDFFGLRAFAPSDVFTATAKGGYLSKVSDSPELLAIANWLFSDDYVFIQSVPESLRPIVVVMMMTAYAKGIRPADRRVGP